MKYESVILHIEQLIKENKLTSGSKLPSVRVLSAELSCSKSTILKAYDTLVKNRLAYVIDKNGYYLMNDPEHLLMSEHVDFGNLMTQPSLLSRNEIQIVFNKGMSESELEIDTEGLFELRDSLKAYFRKKKIFTNVHDLFLLSSKQEALQLISQILVQQSASILVESPSDETAIQFFKRKKNVVFFNRSSESLDFNLMELLIIKNNVKLIYMSAMCHLPYGSDLSLEDKMNLLNLCYKHNVYIIENNMFDDALHYDTTQSLYALDKQDMVFHLKTFDYIFSTKLKICCVVCPHQYSNQLSQTKKIVYGETTYFEQAILYQFLEGPYFLEKKQALNEMIEQKWTLLCQIIDPYKWDKFKLHLSSTHQFIFIELPSYYNIDTLRVELEKKNITIGSVQNYFNGQSSIKGIVLSVASVNKSQIQKSTYIVMDLLKHHDQI